MGGLAGSIVYGGDPDGAEVAAMAERLSHRGPDGIGKWSEGPAFLAHCLRRVSPGTSQQPLVADDAVVLLDGWVRPATTPAAGAAPTGAQVVLEAWRRWGASFAAELDGEFAAAVWERDAQRLLLVRDRMGARPLFWARSGHRMAFASELPALLRARWVSRELASENLAEYLEFQTVHSPRTLVRDAWQVEPAHFLEVDREGVKTRSYWRIRWAEPSSRRPMDRDVIDALQAAVDSAVAIRLDPGAATGLYLSGGLGSTAIAVAARKRFLVVPTFTASFADDPNPESPFAGRIARLLGLENHEVVAGSADLAAAFDPAIRALGHPVGQPAAVIQLLLARGARERVRVVLSGDGGEEVFGGRFLDRLSRGLDFGRWFSRLPSSIRPVALDGLHRTSWGRFSGPVSSWLAELGVGGMGLFPESERNRLLRDRSLVRPDVAPAVLAPMFVGVDTDPVNAAIHGVIRSALVESALVRGDRTAAASGLDIRFPLLDRRVIESAAALPGSIKVRKVAGTLHTRWPLRTMLSGTIPQALVNRPRRGLPVPLDTWLAGPGRLFLEDRFARLKRDRHALWVPARLDELRAGVGRPGVANRQLWSLFLLDAWLEALDSDP